METYTSAVPPGESQRAEDGTAAMAMFILIISVLILVAAGALAYFIYQMVSPWIFWPIPGLLALLVASELDWRRNARRSPRRWY